MKINSFLTLFVLVSGLCLVSSAWAKKPEDVPGNDAATAGKVLVCHMNHHTISISENAWPAHEAHGDWIVDDDNPCPAEGETQGGGNCLGSDAGEFDMEDLNHDLGELTEPLFDVEEGLVYLPQVELDVLGLSQYYAVILQRITDTDFVVRYVEELDGEDGGVTTVGFNGVTTIAPFSVVVVPAGTSVEGIGDVEFSVLQGCDDPVQLSVTNFVLPESEGDQ